MKDQIFELIIGSLNEIKQDIAVIKQDNSDIKETMIINTGSLNEHMRRTAALERHVGILESAVQEVKVYANRYDTFITVLKTLPFILVFTFLATFIIWANINDGSKNLIVKWLGFNV